MIKVKVLDPLPIVKQPIAIYVPYYRDSGDLREDHLAEFKRDQLGQWTVSTPRGSQDVTAISGVGYSLKHILDELAAKADESTSPCNCGSGCCCK